MQRRQLKPFRKSGAKPIRGIVFATCSAFFISPLELTYASTIGSIQYASQSSASGQPNKKQKIDQELRDLLKKAIESADSFEDRFDAEVWLMSMSGRLEPFVKDPQQRLNLLRSIHRASTKAGLQPEIVLAVIQIESRFDRFAVSSVGAQGIMQVMPFWKNEIGRPEDNLIDLETNLKYGCAILKHYMTKAKGRLAEALARYNGSYGSYRYSMKVMDAWEERWR